MLMSLAVALAPFVGGCQSYDVLVEKDQACEQKWADVEANLQRRYDLIPNLVETAKGYMKHERETLEAVIAARNTAYAASKAAAANPADAGAMKGLLGAESGLAS